MCIATQLFLPNNILITTSQQHIVTLQICSVNPMDCMGTCGYLFIYFSGLPDFNSLHQILRCYMFLREKCLRIGNKQNKSPSVFSVQNKSQSVTHYSTFYLQCSFLLNIFKCVSCISNKMEFHFINVYIAIIH